MASKWLQILDISELQVAIEVIVAVSIARFVCINISPSNFTVLIHRMKQLTIHIVSEFRHFGAVSCLRYFRDR